MKQKYEDEACNNCGEFHSLKFKCLPPTHDGPADSVWEREKLEEQDEEEDEL